MNYPPSCAATRLICSPIPAAGPLESSRLGVRGQQQARRDRISAWRPAAELASTSTLEEAEARAAVWTGRPHFAAILLEKATCGTTGRLSTIPSGRIPRRGNVYRRSRRLPEGVAVVPPGGRIASLAHPTRVHGERGGR